jgi:hypothetical protein
LVLIVLSDLDSLIERTKEGFEATDVENRLSVEDDVLGCDIVLLLRDDLVRTEPVGAELGWEVVGRFFSRVEKH